METFGYLHIATTYEDAANMASASDSLAEPLTLFEGVSWKKLPSLAWMPLLSLSLSLSILSVATEAMALQQGEKGCEVVLLQARLHAAGYYDGPIDGVFGPKTNAAVKRFQQAKGLSVDGVAGSRTRSALNANSKTRALKSFEFSRR